MAERKWDPLLPLPAKWQRFASVVVSPDLFGPERSDSAIMNAWHTMGNSPTTSFVVPTRHSDRMMEWLQKWEDVADEPVKLARGPAAIREQHTCGRALLFAGMLELWGEPPEGCAYPAYDWMYGLAGWPNRLRNVKLRVLSDDPEGPQ